ncbi:MAG: acyl-CoA synthetase, partial [Brachybacterium sp.]|nr:acyl-CoA synthetase [Brachybacterium sp.]
MSADASPTGDLPWLVPPAYDASAASLTAHASAIGEVMAGRARLWLGPFDPPAQLPAGFEDTALVVPTSGSTGTAKAVALSRGALLASHDATAQLFAADGTAPDTRGHGFWLPLLPP